MGPQRKFTVLYEELHTEYARDRRYHPTIPRAYTKEDSSRAILLCNKLWSADSVLSLKIKRILTMANAAEDAQTLLGLHITAPHVRQLDRLITA
jgi:hypothetical protein